MASSNVNILTSLGASQIDTQSLVDSLVAAQKQPRQKIIDSEKKKAEVAISNLASLKNALANLQSAATEIGSATKLSKMNVSSTDPSVVTAVSNGNGMGNPGSLTVRVSSLATPQRTVGGALPNSSFPLAAPASITIRQNGKTSLIDIPAGSTLSQARNAINDKLGADGIKVTCAVINNGKAAPLGPNVLVLEGQYGKDQAFSVEATPGKDALGFEPADASHPGPQDLTTAGNAILSVNSVEIERPSNSITDAVGGLTLQLNNAAVGRDIQISSSVDASTISASLKNFVDYYNGLTEFLDKATGQPVDGDSIAGSLSNNSNARAIKNTLRSLMLSESSGKSGNINHWSSIGVAFDKNGVLQYEESKLLSAVNSGFSDVVKALSNGAPTPYLYSGQKSGMAGDIAVKAYGLLKNNGVVSQMEVGFKDQQSRAAKKQDQLDQYIEKLSSNYQRQFEAMNAALSSIGSQKTQITNLMNANNNRSN